MPTVESPPEDNTSVEEDEPAETDTSSVEEEPEESTSEPVRSGPPSLELVSDITQSVDVLDSVHLYGEVQNNGGKTAVFGKVNCAFYKADSSLVDTSFSYIIGSNLVLSRIDATTNTALRSGDKGVFEVWSNLAPWEFSTYECRFSYDQTTTREPGSELIVDGNLTRQKDYRGDVRYLGKLKNKGENGLIFGKLNVVTRSYTGAIIDISSSYVDGETVLISSIDSNTDTALRAGSSGTVSVYTSAPYGRYGSHEVYPEWSDETIVDGVVRSAQSKAPTSLSAKESGKAVFDARTQAIEALRAKLNASE